MLLIDTIDKYKSWGGLGYKRGTTQGTIRGYDLDLRQFCLYMRNPHIESIQEHDVTQYFTQMFSMGWKSNSLMVKSIAIRNLFKYAKQLGLTVMNYELIQIIQRQVEIPRVAEDWEISKLLERCADEPRLQKFRNKCIITFLRSVGCRNNEMCSINVSQIMEHFEERRVLIKTAKSRGVKPIRELYWDEEAHKDLKAWLEVRQELSERITFADSDALFVGVRGWQTGKRMTNGGIAIMLRSLSRRAGLKTVNAHSFRHHRGHELNNMGANNSTISSVLGHSSLASSYIYTQMNSDELHNAADKYRQKHN